MIINLQSKMKVFIPVSLDTALHKQLNVMQPSGSTHCITQDNTCHGPLGKFCRSIRA